MLGKGFRCEYSYPNQRSRCTGGRRVSLIRQQQQGARGMYQPPQRPKDLDPIPLPTSRSLPPPTLRTPPGWPALKLFLIYRCVLLLLLFITLGPPASSLAAWIRQPNLVAWGLLGYLGLLLLGLILLLRQWPGYTRQVQWSVLGDIGVLSLLMYATGGASHGLGLLIAISVVLGSLLSLGAFSVALAAVASLAVIAAELLVELQTPGMRSALPQAGLLGVTYFAVALLALALSRRLHETERFAERQRMDLASLATLNEHVVGRLETGVLVVDPSGDVRLSNRAATRLLGNQTLGRGMALAGLAPALVEALSDWSPGSSRAPLLLNPFPGAAEIRVTIEPLSANPEPGFLLFLEDPALHEQRAQELKLASLGRLSASIAHEIRNPLGAISHAGQLLDEADETTETRRELLAIIERNIHRLNDIVESVLQLSHHEQATPQILALSDWLTVFSQELKQSLGPEATTLQLEIESGLPPVAVDPRHLRQILSILCDNACKHGGADARTGIRLRGRYHAERGALYLEVIDQGVGISPEVVPFIFDPFFTTNPQGTGLGLYLARELSEANRVQLDAIPQPEGGGCFRLTFSPHTPGGMTS